MMLRLRSLISMILVSLLLSTWGTPVVSTSAATLDSITSAISVQKIASSTVPLIVSNRGFARIPVLVIKGTKNYTFYNVQVGRSVFYVERGTYTAEYEACGTKVVKKIIVKGDQFRFRTIKCITVKLIIQNNTGYKMNLSLDGSVDYLFMINPGKTTITVLEGTYGYGLSGLCGTKTGTIKVRAPRVRWTWWCD